MIGFLGTVIGMIVAFHEMASAGGNIDVAMLSQGIYCNGNNSGWFSCWNNSIYFL